MRRFKRRLGVVYASFMRHFMRHFKRRLSVVLCVVLCFVYASFQTSFYALFMRHFIRHFMRLFKRRLCVIICVFLWILFNYLPCMVCVDTWSKIRKTGDQGYIITQLLNITTFSPKIMLKIISLFFSRQIIF
jgi:hypothetical protein